MKIFLGGGGWGVQRGVLKKSPSLPPQTVAKLGNGWFRSIPPMKTLNDLLPILQDAKRDLMAPKKLSECWGKSAPLPDPLPEGERENIVSPLPRAGEG